MSKMHEEFRRMSIRLLNGTPADQSGEHRLRIDDMFMRWKPNQGLGVSVMASQLLLRVIWNDASGGSQVERHELLPYYDKLRRKFVLDELAEL